MGRYYLFIVLLGMLISGCMRMGVPYGGSPYIDPMTLHREEIIHVPTGIKLTKKELFDLIAHLKVVYVGERHDNIYDHQVEFEIIRALYEKFPGRIAVGMEMLGELSQPDIDRWLDGKLEEKALLQIFARDWDISDYPYYRTILNYIRQKKIPLLALNLSHKEEMAIMHKRFKKSPFILKKIDDPYQKQVLQAVFAGHTKSHGGIDIFLSMQSLWEETMAKNIVNYLQSPKGKDKKIVVLAGRFHVAYGYGIPRRVFRQLKVPYGIVVTYTPPHLMESKPETMNVHLPPLPLYLADYLWCVPYRNLGHQ